MSGEGKLLSFVIGDGDPKVSVTVREVTVGRNTALQFDVAVTGKTKTADLRGVFFTVAKPSRAIGTNTVACMQSGVYWGYVGLIEGIVREVRRERERPTKVIATGGLAPLFQQGTALFDSVEDDLTMHGLVLIHRHNKELETA